MEEEIKYFGYGANASVEMMEAIIRRRPDGFTAKLEGYELCVQRWEDIPEKVRKILQGNWGPEFRSYSIRPAKGKSVKGQLWILTKDERELVKNWEITDLWYQPITIDAIVEDGTRVIDVESEMVNNLSLQTVDGTNYPIFLNDQRRMLEVASRVREEFLSQKQEK